MIFCFLHLLIFIVLVLAIQSYATLLIYANLSYGAIILAYLGAVRWAFALPETKVGVLYSY